LKSVQRLGVKTNQQSGKDILISEATWCQHIQWQSKLSLRLPEVNMLASFFSLLFHMCDTM
jgi:hypothetical protein